MKISLIGDSIRMGYQPIVEQMLAGKATIWAPPECNPGPSINTLINAVQWIGQVPADVIHINAGLHDIKCIPKGTGENVIGPEIYASNVDRIIRLAQDWTDARIIWAATTPVIEAHANTPSKWFSRYDDDVIEYNRIAREIADRRGVEFNDLYQVVQRAGPQNIQAGDGVHYTAAGSALLAKAVVALVGI